MSISGMVGVRCALAVALSLGAVAASAAEAEVTYEVASLSETVSMLKGRGGNIAVSVGDEGIYLVDDQLQSISDALLAELRRISDQPIRFVINTHYHGDHVGGNETLGEAGAVIVAHDNVHQRLSTDQFSHFFNETTEAWPDGALPVVTFSERATLHLNGEPAHVIHVARGHTDGDAIVHFPVSDVIHMGDIYFNGLYPFIDLDGGGSLQGMIAAVDTALELAGDATQIIPGHGPLADREDLANYRAFLIAARDRVARHVEAGHDLDETIAARPTAEWDDALGNTWITPAQFVTFIYNSLTGEDRFTRTEANSSD